MASATQIAPPLPALPKVSYQKIDDEESTNPCGVHDGQARAFGYNDFSDFERPDSYIRHIEPLESELAKQVEYDMDEQGRLSPVGRDETRVYAYQRSTDKEWLDAVNNERRKGQFTPISYELFEVVMDRLEKEWFDLTKNIPKSDFAMPSEDSTCAICDDSEGENSNAIVFCDGCNLAVHQDCYGVPYIPEGQWLCRKCTVSPENPVSCRLCPNEGGAFKQTVNGEWVHLLCAIWLPETGVSNDVFMEPITGVENITKPRWKLKCYLCGLHGACIQCAVRNCFLAFHVTCARQEKLLMPMKAAHGAQPVTLTCFCDKHLPKEQQELRVAAIAEEETLEDSPSRNAKLAKSARAYAKTYETGPPLVPAIVVDRIEYYTTKFKISKRRQTLEMISRYWSLKREARRGAPLLKRLHLEPWTANTGGKAQTEEEKHMKLDQLEHLLYDLEMLQELTLAARQRERWKLEQYRAIYRVLENSVLVHERHLAGVFERITKLDRDDYFKNPVSKAEVPDYFDVIQNPMCWAMIEKKLEHHEYWDINAFRDDIELVLDNAMLYNRSGTMHHRAATRIKHAVHPIIEELRQTVGAIVPSDPNEEDSIGDLEPPLELLELLFSAEAIQDELDLVLDDGPLASLLEFTLPKLKPPPPPPPKQPKAKRSSKSKKKQAKGAATAAGHGLPVEPEQGVVEEPMEEGQETTEVLEEQQSAIDETFEDASTVSISAAPKSRKRTGGKPAPSVSTAGSATSAIDTSKRGTRGTTSRASGKVAPSAVEDSQNPSGTQISARDSFSMFNIGWILPSDEKRGGRKSVDRSAIPPPPPRKRMRTGPGPSRLSIVDTAPADSQPVSETAEPVDESVPDDAPGPVVELPETSAEGPLQDNIVPSSIEPASEEISTATPQLDIAPHQQPSPPQDEHTEPFSAPTPVTTAKDTRTSVPPPVHALAPESTPAVVTDGTVPEPEGMSVPRPVTAAIEPEASPIPQVSGSQLPLESQSIVNTTLSELDHRQPLAPPSSTPTAVEATASSNEATFDEESRPLHDKPDSAPLNEAHSEPQPELEPILNKTKVSPTTAPSSGPPHGLESNVDESEASMGVFKSQEYPETAAKPALSRAAPSVPDSDQSPVPQDDTPADKAASELSEEGAVSISTAASRPRRIPTHQARASRAAPPLSAKITQRVIEENGRKVLETLDTPELRRKKAMERRRELNLMKKQLAEQRQPQAGDHDHQEALSGMDAEGSGAAENHNLLGGDLGAEIPSASASGSKISVKRRKKAKGGRQPVGDDVVDPDNVLVQPGQNLDGGTIVWAQATSYPWWPGVIWDPTHWQTPVNLKTQLEKANRNSETSSYIVQFFDKHKTWQILSHKQLRMLGEDKDFDADLVAEKSKRQWVGWTAKNMQACRASYEIALNEMETPSDVENAAKLATEVVVDANPLPKDVEQVAE